MLSCKVASRYNIGELLLRHIFNRCDEVIVNLVWYEWMIYVYDNKQLNFDDAILERQL